MLHNQVESKITSAEKSSKSAALLTLAGAVLVVAALVFSFFQLQKLNNEIAEKKNQSIELDAQIEEQRRRLQETQKNLEETEQALSSYQESVKEIDPTVAETALNQTIEKSPQFKQVIEQVKELKPTPTPTTAPPPVNQPKKDKRIALEKEREGFQALIAGDYDTAITAFQASENAYNSFHNVYELARLLRRNKSQMNDPAKRKEVFQTIVRKHSYGAPPDLWKQVVSIASQ